MENAIHSEKVGRYTVKIYQDTDPLNPRTDYDNFGKMVCAHRRYILGDEQINVSDFDSWKEVADWLKSERGAAIILPLRLYDHSGISMSTTTNYPYNDHWDSGQVGFIYCTSQQIADEFGGDVERAKNCLVSEVETYDDYLTGNVWGFVVEDEDGETADSCWGYFGDYDGEYGALSEGLAVARTYEKDAVSGDVFEASFMCC